MCGAEEQSPDHILQSCPHLDDKRQEVWSDNTPLHTKLWGHVDHLQRAVQFVAASGQGRMRQRRAPYAVGVDLV